MQANNTTDSSAAAASSGSKRTRAQTRASSAAAASPSSSATGSGLSAASSPSPLSVSGTDTTADKRQRRTDEQRVEFKARASSEDERMVDDAGLRKSGALSGTDSDPFGAAVQPLQVHHGGHMAQSIGQAHSNAAGPIGRLDLDSLSVVLSLLSSDDFLSAIRSNKQFYAARLKRTAWPALQLESFIQSLRDDDYDNPARRRLRLHAIAARVPQFAAMLPPADDHGAPAHAAALSVNMWRHVTDAHVYSYLKGHRWPGDPRPSHQPYVNALLPQLALLPFLTAVNLHQVEVSVSAFTQFAAATAPRLQVLMYEGASQPLSMVDPMVLIGLLSGLRVLVIDRLTYAAALLPLTQLEYLHFGGRLWGPYVAPAAALLRYLSSSHALRSLSLSCYASVADLLPLLCGSGPARHIPRYQNDFALPNPAAALVDWTCPCGLTALACSGQLNWRDARVLAADSLPSLVLLQACICKRYRWEQAAAPPLPLDFFSRLLQQLRLTIDESDLLQHVAQCKQLRRLQPRAPFGIRATTEMLCAIIESNAASLEELRLCHFGLRGSERKGQWPSFATIIEADENNPEDVAEMERWCVLAGCPRLRIVELPIKNEVAPQLLRALAKAPVFQALELSLSPRLYPQSAVLLHCALTSPSWCTIRFLCAQSTQLRDAAELEELLSAAGAASDSAPSSAALRRLRVFARRCAGTEHCFMLHPTAAGSFEWQREY